MSRLSLLNTAGWSLLVAVIYFAARFPGDAAAAQPWPAAGQDSKAEQKILAALSDSTQMEFIEVPLTEAAEYLSALHGINVVLDGDALAKAGLDKDVPLTANLKGIRLRSALNLLLRDLGLAYSVSDDVLLITTRERLESRELVRMYDVAAIVEKGPAVEELAEALQATLGERARIARPVRGGAAAGGFGGRPVVDGRRAHIHPLRTVLVVRANEREQRQVAETLGKIALAFKVERPNAAAAAAKVDPDLRRARERKRLEDDLRRQKLEKEKNKEREKRKPAAPNPFKGESAADNPFRVESRPGKRPSKLIRERE